MEYINKVFLRGTLSYFDELPDGRVAVTICTLNATQKPNSPKVIFPKKMAEDIKENYKRGDHITIEGKIVTWRPKRKEKRSIRQYIYGYSIEKTPFSSEKTMGIKMGRVEPPVNNVFLAGNVIYVKPVNDELVNIVIGVKEKSGFITRIKVCYFVHANHMKKFLSLIYEGAEVQIVGNYQTAQKTTSETRYTIKYENIVVDDIQFEEKSYEEEPVADIHVSGCEAAVSEETDSDEAEEVEMEDVEIEEDDDEETVVNIF